ncbi:MAG: Aquaporin, partial [Actinomycetota bacterium]|nr:Aquaporin [Actinomycetota bacterium]
ALVSGEWGGVWPYLVGEIVGAILAFVVYKFIIAPGSGDKPDAEVKKPSTIPSPEA